MNRKSVVSAWVLHKIDASYETDDDSDDKDINNDEEYHGNYTFIVIEDNKKKCKLVASNIKTNLLQKDEDFEDE
jgi:hypothetical protein